MSEPEDDDVPDVPEEDADEDEDEDKDETEGVTKTAPRVAVNGTVRMPTPEEAKEILAGVDTADLERREQEIARASKEYEGRLKAGLERSAFVKPTPVTEAEKPVCSSCEGTGKIWIDDSHTGMCHCLRAKLLKSHLGPEISSAPIINKSPLYMHVKNGPPKVDLTAKNVFIKAPWQLLLAHLQWALGVKGLDFHFLKTDDKRLLDIWLGSESYANRSKSKRDSQETFNSIRDFIGEDRPLVIIRLGQLGWKNIAMPGILKEALMVRESLQKPTWLVETPEDPYQPGHLAYSPETYEYILGHFQYLDLVPDGYEKVTVSDEYRDNVGVDEAGAATAVHTPITPPRRPRPRPEPESEPVSRYERSSSSSGGIPGLDGEKKPYKGRRQ